jgi:hypothetical protein
MGHALLTKDLCVMHALSMLILYLEVSPKKNPNNFCAFDAMLFMYAAVHPRSCWIKDSTQSSQLHNR